VYKKGGLTYIETKIKMRSLHAKPSILLDSKYLDKVGLFKSLPNSQDDVYFVGDSITQRCNWDELFNNLNCKNRGIGSDTTEGILNRLQEITEGHPKKVFIMIGINDIGNVESLNVIKNNLREIVSKIASSSPNTDIYMQSLLPVNKSKYQGNIRQSDIVTVNEYIKGLALSEHISYIDLFPNFADSTGELRSDLTTDGVHLNAMGYYIWKGVINKYIR
jgi:lysophospholipase L1-like esterase